MASQMSPQVVQLVVWTKGEEMGEGEGEEEKMPDDDAGDAGELANEGLDPLCRLPQAVYVHVVASAGRAALVNVRLHLHPPHSLLQDLLPREFDSHH